MANRVYLFISHRAHKIGTKVLITATNHFRKKRVLVLGAYGFIGAYVFRALENSGFETVGLGRNLDTAKRVLPDRKLKIFDISKLLDAKDWLEIIRDFDIVVNCSGALQDGPNTNLEALQFQSIKALSLACRSNSARLIQISALGAEISADTNFLRTKAFGDAEIKKNAPDYAIIKPGMVFASSAFGGSALVRMMAAFPFFQPLALARAQIQTVGIADLSEQICELCRAPNLLQLEIPLAEETPLELKDVILATRQWLGFGKPKFVIELPSCSLKFVSKFADLLGKWGWRSPLRSTAISVLTNGVVSKHEPGEKRVNSLHQTFNEMPARSEDRLAARAALLFPITIAILASFWVSSGLIGIFQVQAAAMVLISEGWPYALAASSVLIWSVVDIALGVLVLMRRYAKRACIGMMIVSLIYLVSATIFVPQLWIEPLGPMLKIFPSILLALHAITLLEDR